MGATAEAYPDLGFCDDEMAGISMRSRKICVLGVWPIAMKIPSTGRSVTAEVLRFLMRTPVTFTWHSIPDEILDYYGWVFCQGGFLNLQMTFEQFLTVVAAVSPSGLCPEYDDDGSAVSTE